jgi:predicted nucleotidyltransferase
MRKKTRNVERAIRKMVGRIVRQFHPERIILFGSHARGEAGPESDVDLLVVMPVEGLKHNKQVEIRVALHDIRIPKDIIVTTPEDFAWRKDVVGTIEYPAVKEGIVFYVEAEQLAVASEAALLREKDCPTARVCFHAQQAVEKYLKALLATLRGTPFPKTHNIRRVGPVDLPQ